MSWRSSSWYVTWVGYGEKDAQSNQAIPVTISSSLSQLRAGIAIDLLVYSLIIPVIPFQLERLGYQSISARTGWLLFAFSFGLVASTPPLAYLSERYHARRIPLVWALIVLIASQILFMEAPTYWVMVIARILQGVSSTAIWSLGTALLCDVVPKSQVGRQLGLAMIGLSVGLVAAPPLGGVLYAHFGFKAPFIFGIILAVADLVFRLLVLEPKISPSGIQEAPHTIREVAERQDAASDAGNHDHRSLQVEGGRAVDQVATDVDSLRGNHVSHLTPLSGMTVTLKLLTSSRALAACFNTLFYGIIWTALEPTLPLRLQAVYGFSSQQVGLALLACVLPTLLSSPLSGYLSDKAGAELVLFISLQASLPWWALMAIRGRLPLLLSSLALATFFASGVVAPIMTELARVTDTLEGVGYAHVYGAFNLAYGLGSARPLLGGEIYGQTRGGWAAVCMIDVASVIVAATVVFFYSGKRPLSTRMRQQWCSG